MNISKRKHRLMRFEGYGVQLIRVREEHLELLRTKRNSELVRQFMIYKEDISPEQQSKWFRAINNLYNYYFIIHFEQRAVGLINGKEINYLDASVEGGIFIWEEKLMDTPVPIQAAILFTDWAFQVFPLKRAKCKTLRSNLKAIKFNRSLGYQVVNEESTNQYLMMSVRREVYLRKSDPLRQYLFKQWGEQLRLVLEEEDFQSDNAAMILALYHQLKGEVKERLKLIIENAPLQNTELY